MSNQFDEVVKIMARLRELDGCPWDRKQTHESLKPYLLEETYEVLETIDHEDFAKLKEELGDLLLQILFHAQIGSEAGRFTIQDVMEQLAEKLVRRHPHVFDKAKEQDEGLNADQVYSRWEEIKREERSRTGNEGSALDGVPKTLPALLRAYQIQARASRVGFDWPHSALGRDQMLGKIDEELKELCEAVRTSPDESSRSPQTEAGSTPSRQIEAELGDTLFSLVNLARFLKVNPEDALRRASNRFTERFHYVEAEAARVGRRLQDMTLTEMDRLWEEAKAKNTEDQHPSERMP